MFVEEVTVRLLEDFTELKVEFLLSKPGFAFRELNGDTT
jgi:hypothetical protein